MGAVVGGAVVEGGWLASCWTVDGAGWLGAELMCSDGHLGGVGHCCWCSIHDILMVGWFGSVVLCECCCPSHI